MIKLYTREIIKRPFGSNVVSDFITSEISGLGIKNKKIYKCYSNEFVKDWLENLGTNGEPEDFGFHYIFDTFGFDWYINLKEHTIE